MPTPAAAHPEARSYWIGVASSDHVALAVAGGFIQLNHGKAGPLERMRVGDGFACYSPRTAYPDGESRAGVHRARRVTGDAIVQVDRAEASCRFDGTSSSCVASPAPIRPLIDALSFIRSKLHWGAAFRFGHLRVPADDFARIVARDGPRFRADFGRATRAAACRRALPPSSGERVGVRGGSAS